MVNALLDMLAQWRAHPASRRRWQRWLDASDALRRAAAHDGTLSVRCQTAYISRLFDEETRCEIAAAHYRFLHERFPPRLGARLIKGHDAPLIHFMLANGHSAHVHLRPPMMPCCGELGLYLLTEEKNVLASCTFTFAGRHGVLIGAMHGSWSFMGKQPTRIFTRAAYGLRPKNLLLSLVYALADLFAIERIRAVADAVRPADRHLRRTAPPQDAFWLENAALPDGMGNYLLPVPERRRPLEQVPSKRRSARRRREHLRQELCTQARAALSYAMPLSSPCLEVPLRPSVDGTAPSLGPVRPPVEIARPNHAASPQNH